MAYDFEGARAAGLSEQDIANYLAKKTGYDLPAAIKAGLTYEDVNGYLEKKFTSAAAPAPAPAAPAVPVKREERPEDQSFLRQVADVPLKVGAGLVTGIRMIADAAGADSSTSKTLRGVEDWVADLYSAQSKQDTKEIGRIMEAAKDAGVADQVAAAVKAFSVAPVDMMANALGTAAPAIAAGLITTLFGAPVLAATAVGAGVGAAMGAGTIKGAIYDATKQALQEHTRMSPKEIEARAITAQEYGGQNLDQILMGAGLGAFGASSGVEPALARQIAKGIITKEAAKAALKENLKKETVTAAERGAVKHGLITGGKEFLGEGLEGGQEQLAQNIALQRMGFDVPTMRGVVGQGTLEGLAGLGMGAAGGARESFKAQRELAEDATKGQKGAQQETVGDLTTAKEEPQRAGMGFDQESADALMPATDAADNPLVSGVTKPEVTVTPPPPAKEKKQKAEPIKPEDVTPESVQAAKDYVTKIDSGEPIKQSDYRKVATALGIKIPFGTKNADGVEIIRQHLAQQGAPSVTESGQQTAGASTTVAGEPASINAPGTTAGADINGVAPVGTDVGTTAGREGQQPAALNVLPEGTTSGTETVETKQTETQRQEAPAAPAVTAKKIEDLPPEIQAEIKRRQDEIADIEMDGGDASKKKAQLNKLLAKQGVSGTLSAKSVEKDFLEEGELPYAVEGEDKSRLAEEQERVQAYKDSLTNEKGKARTIPDYDISEEDKRLYNELRDEINPQVKAANEKRSQLIAEQKAAEEAYRQAKEGSEKDAAFDRLNAAEDALDDHGPEQRELPEYTDKFAADYKDVYFGNITAGPLKDGRRTFGSSKREHYKAAKALQEYLQRTKSTDPARARRIANHYEEARAEASEASGITFPSWGRLTQEQKNIFLNNMPTMAGVQLEDSFLRLASNMRENGQLTSEGEMREEQNKRDIQEQVRRESEEQNKRDRKTREAYERNKPAYSSLPNSIVQMVMSGDLQGILNYMSGIKLDSKSAPSKRIMKVVAKALAAMNLNTKIKIVESKDINGDLAQYDPVGDVILVSKEGLSVNTILHEIIHAATVKVINEYLYGNKGSLSALQLNGIKQLERIMNETRGALAENHPEAYKNLFEFVSYALTSEQLQQDLHDESVTAAGAEKLHKAVYGTADESAIGKILPESKSQWSQFKLAIARILKIRDDYLVKGKLDKTADTNYLMEITAAFEDILVKPTGGIYLPVLSAKQAKPTTPKQAEPARETGLYDRTENVNGKDAYDLSEKENPTKKSSVLWRTLTTRQGWRKTVTNLQDKSYHSRSLFNKLDMAGKINRDMSGAFNNFDEHRDLATGEAKQFVVDYLQEPLDSLHQTFQNWMKLSKQNTDDALNQFHRLAEMFHEPERRHVKWLMSVPLSKTQNLKHNGKPISAAERRIAIVGDPRTGKPGLIHKVDLTQQQQQALRQELEMLAKNHADPLGDSPRGIKATKETDAAFNVLGIEKAAVDKRMAEFDAKSPEEKALIMKMMADIKTISDATAKLNQIGNYWSTPVSNLVGIYDYQNYMPFKGLSKNDIADDLIDFDSKVNGSELQEKEFAADGRFSVSNNPVLQLMSDAYRSAGRAGRRNYTQAIKNSLEKSSLNPNGTGVIPGKVVKHIKFEERSVVDLREFNGGANIFHYNPDGSIDILRVTKPEILHALRYSFRDANPMLDMANSVTGFFGAMHTRFNYNFAPLNFVRDALTNAWNIGASRQMGPKKSLQYLGLISQQVVKNGLGKAMKVAMLEEKGDAASKKMLLDMAEKDPFVRDMLEYLRFGGKTTYLEGFSLKSNLQELSKNTLGTGRVVRSLKDWTKLIDCWNNMFEFTSRASAYSLYKEQALKRQIDAGVSNTKGPQGQMSPAERAAATEAAAWVKNLANFEKVGEYGRAMGAAYMFSRPSATGAVRAVEALLPAFTSEKSMAEDIPPQIANDEAAKAKYLESFKQDRRNAQIMVGALMGMGYGMYLLSMLGAPDDEWRRNNTKTDNMEQWTRFARFHIPDEVSKMAGLGKDVVFQVPWGFGLGSFAAAGAQFGGMTSGTTSLKDGLSNIAFTIMTDAFLPIPVSKIPFTDAPLNWFIDSAAPTVLRPLIEFVANKNGIGQTINSASMRRMGDAFTGGDRIPEIYKEAAKELFRKTDGYIDWSPNTLYFFANSYLDGASKLAETTYSWAGLAKGEKEFNVKTDVPLFGSFFGAKTNVDSREYGKIEEQIKEIDKRLTTMKSDDPSVYGNYLAKHPLHQAVVDAYHEQQGQLNALRQKANEIRNMKGLTPAQRDQVLKVIVLEQNMFKHQMVLKFKALDMQP